MKPSLFLTQNTLPVRFSPVRFAGDPPEPLPAEQPPMFSPAKQRLLKKGRTLALKFISNIPGFSWAKHLEKLDANTIQGKVKSSALWLGIHLAGLSVPLYGGVQWYGARQEIGALQQHHTQTGALISQFKGAVLPKDPAKVSTWDKAATMIGLNSTPEQLQQALIKAVPETKQTEAQKLLENLTKQEHRTDTDYRNSLKAFIKLINQNNALDPINQARLETAMTEAFDQGLHEFEYPAFQSPESMDLARQRYLMLFLLSSLAMGVFVTGEFAVSFVLAKVELAKSIAQTAQDATEVVQEYWPKKAAPSPLNPPKPASPPSDSSEQPG